MTKTKRTKIILCITLAVVFALLIAGFLLAYLVYQVPLFDQSGWDESEEGVFRYLNYYGKPLLQWQKIDGDRYYFDPADGTMVTGWLDTLEGRYYLGDDGTMHTGWLDTQDGRYYLDENGIMATGWLDTENGRCYLDESGVMVTGWLIQENGRYYLNETGTMATGWLDIDGARYYFAESGVMQTGWLDTEEARYYLDTQGAMCVGWQDIGDGRYYFDDTGVMQTGWVDTAQGRYYLNEQGVLQTKWVETEDGWFYLTDDGSAHTGWLEIEGKKYFFSETGVMQTGWITTPEGRYYLYEDGTMATGFVEISGVSRYFMPTGEYIVLVNCWNPVPEDYERDLVYIQGYQVDATCREALEDMLSDCRNEGYFCELNSAYRSVGTQQYLWDNRYNNYIVGGYSEEEANRLTGQVVAVPGTSEHHLGLAVDITGSDSMYAWLAEHSWEYGFILRYPDDKIEVTGIIYEPWHFRYVGKELAKDIYESGLCLEEYLAMLALEKK